MSSSISLRLRRQRNLRTVLKRHLIEALEEVEKIRSGELPRRRARELLASLRNQPTPPPKRPLAILNRSRN